MKDYRSELEKQLKEIEILLEKTNKKIEELSSVPDQVIRIHRSNGHDQYYLIEKKTGEKRYIKTSEYLSLRDIAQKDYDKKIRKELIILRHGLELFLRNYHVQRLNEVYERMADGRKALIEPLIETDEQFVNRWQSIVYEEMKFYDETEFFTSRGIRVRSKSEILMKSSLVIVIA